MPDNYPELKESSPSSRGGSSSEIVAILMELDAFNYLDALREGVMGADVPMGYAKECEDAALPKLDDILAAIECKTYHQMVV